MLPKPQGQLHSIKHPQSPFGLCRPGCWGSIYLGIFGTTEVVP
jgi:hypothetical protein